MKFSLLLPTFSILLFLSVRCQEVQPLPITGETEKLNPQQMEEISETLSLFPENTQLALAIIEGGEVEFVGLKNEADSISIVANHEALFEIGSISKVFTGTLLAQMVQEGKLSLDESIDEKFDIPLADGISITFEQLANHSSGLPRIPPSMNMAAFFYPDNPYRAFTDEKMEDYLKAGPKPSSSKTGSYGYSNLGMGMLAYLMGKMEGKSYADLLEDRVFTPLGMENSYGDWRLVEEGIVPGQNPKGNPTANWDLGPLAGAGSIVSNVADLSRFAMAQFDSSRRDFQFSHQPTLEVNAGLKVGLGWHWNIESDGREVLWHNGGTGGYSSCMTLEPEMEQGVIILSNLSTFHNQRGKIDDLCFSLLSGL